MAYQEPDDTEQEQPDSEDQYKTSATGYFENPTYKACRTCSFFTKPGICNNPEVLQDPDIPGSPSGKNVDALAGLCNEWNDPSWDGTNAKSQPDALKEAISASRPFGGGYK